jgi:hypothetical protein
MTQEHPITPSPDLIRQWNEDAATAPMADQRYIAIQAARWGADQELKACCTWLSDHGWIAADPKLHAARRPKSPSLKERALEALNEAVYMADDSPPEGISTDQADIIRRALEQLDD